MLSLADKRTSIELGKEEKKSSKETKKEEKEQKKKDRQHKKEKKKQKKKGAKEQKRKADKGVFMIEEQEPIVTHEAKGTSSLSSPPSAAAASQSSSTSTSSSLNGYACKTTLSFQFYGKHDTALLARTCERRLIYAHIRIYRNLYMS